MTGRQQGNSGRIPVRRLRRGSWETQKPTWREAQPAVIEAALHRAGARPSGNWFVLGASSDVVANRPLGRTVGGVELVAWRSTDGGLSVAPGACPHLGAPLCLAAVNEGRLLCRWHGLSLGPEGFAGWTPLPSYDDGVLAWVRLDDLGNEAPSPTPVLPVRPAPNASVEAVVTLVGRCEPEDVVANRLDPWHGAWFHPYSFAELRVLDSSTDKAAVTAADRLLVEVSFRLAGRVAVPVIAEFSCPEPRTVVMRIIDGEGQGSVVETHATPIGPDEFGHPRTAVIEATVASSGRTGFALWRRGAPAVRPLMRFAARRLWRDDLAYAERRYALRAAARAG